MYGGVLQRVINITNGRVKYVAASNTSCGNKISQMSVRSKEKIWLVGFGNKKLTEGFIIHPTIIRDIIHNNLNDVEFYQLVS